MTARRAPRLLVLCDTVARAGGTESYLSRILPDLRDAGIELQVLARSVQDERAFGVDVTQIPWAGDVDPPAHDAAEQVAALRLDVTMHMLGYLDETGMTAAFDASTLVVVPSTWPEPFELIGIEAYARGRPTPSSPCSIINAGRRLPRRRSRNPLATRPARTPAVFSP